MDIVVLLVLFAVSVVANASPFFGVSYTLIGAAALSDTGVSATSFAAVVAITAVGASIAKAVIYFGGVEGRRFMSKNKNMQAIQRWANRRSFFVALFITALIPVLPLDDFLYLGAGVGGARLLPALLVTFPAKIIKGGLEIALEITGLVGIKGGLDLIGMKLSLFQLSLVLSLAFVALGVLIYKIDWTGLLSGKTDVENP